MRSLITRLIILGASMSVTACATSLPPQNHLDAGARQYIKKVDGVLIAKQDRIGADIKRNATLTQVAALMGGASVIPILVDAGVTGVRTAEANKMAKPMRESLKDYDYPWEFRKQIKQSLAGTTLGDIDQYNKFTVVREEFPGSRGQFIEDSTADAVLFVDMRYGFTPSFQTLYVKSRAMLFPNNQELKQFQEKPDRDNVIEFSDNIYRNQYSASLSTGLKEASKSENAAHWAKMSEEKLVDLLERAGLVLADAIANDISIDDLESDLNLLPEGYVLNTEYSNLNQKFANTKAGTGSEAIEPVKPSAGSETTPAQESEAEATVTKAGAGS